MKPKNEYLPDWNLVRTTELTNSEKALLFILKYHYGRNEYTSVGQKCLATESRLSRTTVGTLLRSIERKGWISITNREHATCEYRLNPGKFRAANTTNSTSPVESNDNPLSNDATGGCTTSKHKGNITKIEKAKEKNQDFAGEPATPSQSPQNTEPVGREEVVVSELTSSPTKTDTPANVPVLEKIYRTRIPEKFPDHPFIAELTMKERGQLRDYIHKLENHDPIKIFDTVISNWSKFKDHLYCLNLGDYSTLPIIPSISFLLMHVSHTVNFAIKYEKQKEKPNSRFPVKPVLTSKGLSSEALSEAMNKAMPVKPVVICEGLTSEEWNNDLPKKPKAGVDY